MAFSRLSKLRTLTETFRDRLGLSSKTGKKDARKSRLLRIDPLEERQLLSLTVGSPSEYMVNQTFTPYQTTAIMEEGDLNVAFNETREGGQALAADHDGDFVVTWTRDDQVMHPVTGDPIIDPDTGNILTDQNIYARYFTDEVQRVTLPEQLSQDVLADKYGRFSFTYGGNEIQELRFFTANEPFTYGFFQNMQGFYEIGGFDATGDGVEDWAQVQYNETDNVNESAHQIELALQGIGGVLEDVKVTPIDAHRFTIEFGDAAKVNGMPQDMPELQTRNPNLTGFLPGITVTTVNEPMLITHYDYSGNPIGIPFVPDDPEFTASQIKYAFSQTNRDVQYAPLEFYATVEIENNWLISPATSPEIDRFSPADVSVRYVGDMAFDITFTNEAGKIDHPELIVTSAMDEFGNEFAAEADVITRKQSSPEFRVNGVEEDDPLTPYPDVLDQRNPAVAMDPDGEFIITWEGEVTNLEDHGSNTDIFARRFTPQGMIPENEVTFFSNGEAVQGVRPLGNQFQVNEYTNDHQVNPAISMDGVGNFVIAWANQAQDYSYFENIKARWYTRDAEPTTGDVQVNTEVTSEQTEVFVGMSDEGYTVITWNLARNLFKDVYAPGSTTPFVDNALVASSGQGFSYFVTGMNSALEFDANNRYIISYTRDDQDETGVFAQMFGINHDPATGTHSETQLRGEFAANSPGTQHWPLAQYNSSVGIDADGDFVIGYQGYGPDTSINLFVPGSYFEHLINPDKNGDLLNFFDPTVDSIFGGVAGDVEEAIRYELIDAYHLGATDEQLGRLNAVFETVLGQMRGGSNEIMYTTYDADVGLSNAPYTDSDVVVNNHRDGHNARYFLTIPDIFAITGGSFNLQFWRDRDILGSPVETAQADVVANNNALNVGATMDNIHDALTGMAETFNAWSPEVVFDGPIEIRVVPTFELLDRDDTVWSIYDQAFEDLSQGIVYEITFQGSTHDNFVSFSMGPGSSLTRPDTNGNFIGDVEIFAEYVGEEGTIQHAPYIAMQPDGDFVQIWTEMAETTNHSLATQNIYFREFNETTDHAGPEVTDFILPNGDRLSSNEQLTYGLQHMIVSFDEEMATSGLHSVTNVENWALMSDGVEIPGAIKSIEFGMSHASERVTSGPLQYGSNKWEAVITFDANGDAEGNAALGDGQYELVAKNLMRDISDNALGRQGQLVDGENFSRTFNIVAFDGVLTLDGNDGVAGLNFFDENLVNTNFTQEQQYLGEDVEVHVPSNPSAVASDASGNYVIAWTSEGIGQDHVGAGVYVQTYEQIWNIVDGKRISHSVPGDIIRVTNDPTAKHAAVAMDADGDFVVTWSQFDQETSWDVYAQLYNFQGEAKSGIFMANTYTDSIQQYSSVAMDSDGDFVITWESLDQDGSGYGIYNQRYSPNATPLGGSDELQVIHFNGQPEGNMRLEFNGMVTGDIAVNMNAAATAQNVEQALMDLGLEVVVEATTMDSLLVQFVGEYGSQDLPQLTVESFPGLQPGEYVRIQTLVDGATGETLVNGTTLGNQRYPDVAMSADGDFTISWTGWGAAGDAPYESNIYAKKFVSNDSLRGTSSQNTVPIEAILSQAAPSPGFELRPAIVTPSDPGNYIVAPGTGLDGVVSVNISLPTGGGSIGSGTLLTSGYHVLTAAHVVADDLGNAHNPSDITINFETPGGLVQREVSGVYMHPTYNGDATTTVDLAVVVLKQPAPAEVERYELYRDSDEIGKTVEKVGYGRSGTGDVGMVLPSGVKRNGFNTYDIFADTIDPNFLGDILAYDFDDGTAQHDAFGALFGVSHTGLGNSEVTTAPGDSGGPGFIDGKVAGVTSMIMSATGPHDLIPGLQSSFGDMAVDVRVSAFADWVDSVMVGGGSEILVNETITSNQNWSSVAMDAEGNFVVTWTSFNQDGAGDGPGGSSNGLNGVYARRFDTESQAISGEFRVNQFIDDDQMHSQVAMDANGDFVVTWQSYQDRSPEPNGLMADEPNSFGIYAQRYLNSSDFGLAAGNVASGQNSPANFPIPTINIPGIGAVGLNGEIGQEFQVNKTIEQDQLSPSVALSHAGDMVFVWHGYGQDDDQGVYHRRLPLAEDHAPPVVTDVINVVPDNGDYDLSQVLENRAIDVLQNDPNQFIISFSEDLFDDNLFAEESVLNLGNWSLIHEGIILPTGIVSVEFGMNQAFLHETNGVADPLTDAPTGKYEAVITFDGDNELNGLQPLEPGEYELIIGEEITDLFGNQLDGDYDGVPGTDFTRTFFVGGDVTPDDGPSDDDDEEVFANDLYDQTSPAVASNGNGAFVVVGMSYGVGEPGDPTTWTDPDTNLPIYANILARRYDADGNQMGAETIVNSFLHEHQYAPDVAMNHFGNYVVVWAGDGETENSGVFARIYDTNGIPTGEQFQVNVGYEGVQESPKVAIDATGNIFVTWETYNESTHSNVIRGRQFNFRGEPVTGEMTLGSKMHSDFTGSDLAMDSNGNMVLTWQERTSSNTWDIFAKVYNVANGFSARTGAIHVNTYTHDQQTDPRVAIDENGRFVVTWQSLNQDGSHLGVYARRFNLSGQALSILGSTAGVRINQQTQHDQSRPDVAMAEDGKFMITWTTFDQEGENFDPDPDSRIYLSDNGVYARIFNPNGSNYSGELNNNQSGEFLVNNITNGNQENSVVAMDADGDYVVAWEGPDQYFDGYYPDNPDDPTEPLNPGDEPLFTGTLDIYFNAGDRGGGNWLNQDVALTSSYQNRPSGGGYATSTPATTLPSGPETVFLSGTEGDDLFEFIAGATPSSWIVRVNGVVQSIPLTSVGVQFNGMGGTDRAILRGSDAQDVVTIDAGEGRGSMISRLYDVTVRGMEAIEIDGDGGTEDLLTVIDSAGDDLLVATQEGITLSGEGFQHQATGFETMIARATRGEDTVKLYDSAGDDRVRLSQAQTVMFAGDLIYQADNFERVHTYASDGHDQAYLYGTPADEHFAATSGSAIMKAENSTNAYMRAQGFDLVGAFGLGGEDTANFFDSAGHDVFTGTPKMAQMNFQNGVQTSAFGFSQMEATSHRGNDEAILVGSQKNDSFQGTAEGGRLSSADYELQVHHFAKTNVIATKGISDHDSAILLDTEGDDVVRAHGPRVLMEADGEDLYQLIAFDQVTVQKENGGDDQVESTVDYLFKMGAWD